MSNKRIITTNKAPAAIGPYSIANQWGNLVFTAGQLGLDPETNEFVQGGIEEQTRQALSNVKNILEAAGTSLENVLKTTVFLQDMGDFIKMNGVYQEFFKESFPARSAVEVAALPKGGLVEIEAVAGVSE